MYLRMSSKQEVTPFFLVLKVEKFEQRMLKKQNVEFIQCDLINI